MSVDWEEFKIRGSFIISKILCCGNTNQKTEDNECSAESRKDYNIYIVSSKFCVVYWTLLWYFEWICCRKHMFVNNRHNLSDVFLVIY